MAIARLRLTSCPDECFASLLTIPEVLDRRGSATSLTIQAGGCASQMKESIGVRTAAILMGIAYVQIFRGPLTALR